MGWRQVIGTGVALVVAGTLLVAPAQAGPVGPVAAQEDGAVAARSPHTPPVISRTGELTVRAEGAPTTAEPARNLVSATVTQDVRFGRIRVQLRLGEVATHATESNAVVALGRQTPTGCVADTSEYVRTRPGSGHLADYGSDGSISFEKISSEARTAAWDCAGVGLVEIGNPANVYDLLSGALHDVRAAPEPALEIQAPEKLSVKPGRWKKLKVRVHNPGTGPAKATSLRLSGTGVKTKPRRTKVGTVAAGATKKVTVRVRSKGRVDRQLKVRAASGSLRSSRQVELRAKFKPRRPVPGSYRGAPSVTFKITRQGRIKGWRGSVRYQCGYGTEAWWMNSMLSMPKQLRIKRNGQVRGVHRGKDDSGEYTIRLEAFVDGNRVTRGRLRYTGPGQCSGWVDWTAKRRGR